MHEYEYRKGKCHGFSPPPSTGAYVHKAMAQRPWWVHAVYTSPQNLVIHTQNDRITAGVERGHDIFSKNNDKNAIRENPGNRVGCPRWHGKTLGDPKKKKVRKQQDGVIDSTAVLALFAQLAVVVSIPWDALTCAWNILQDESKACTRRDTASKTCLSLKNGLRQILRHVLEDWAWHNPAKFRFFNRQNTTKAQNSEAKAQTSGCRWNHQTITGWLTLQPNY